MSSSTPVDQSSKAQYIYKIVPSTPAIPLESAGTGAQATLPAAYRLYSSALDKKDGFVHMSTASQVPRTLNRFFASAAAGRDIIYLFRVAYADLEGRADVRIHWESTDGTPGQPWFGDDGVFPHIYLVGGGGGVHGDGLAVLGGSKDEAVAGVESVAELVSEEGEEGWNGALGRVNEWLV